MLQCRLCIRYLAIARVLALLNWTLQIYSRNLGTVEELSASEGGAVVASIGKVRLWISTLTVEHGHKR